jgi:putative ABC transport system permease protein
VRDVETRVVADIRLEIEDFTDPVTGRILSVPDSGEPLLNGLFIREGRTVEAGRDDEVVLNEAFFEAHRFSPGDTIDAIINGRRRTLTIVGIALSPEFIYQLKPGGIIPDFVHYGVMWMARTPLASAYDMEGAFNDVVLTLTKDAVEDDVIDRLDALLEPYGGLGALGREYQVSHRYLNEEFRQLDQMAAIFSTIFLGVAAFLLNIVITRLISTQREQIAAFKAFGYSNLDVGLHYIKLIVMVVLLGLAIGTAGGIRLGQGLSNLYMDYYRFPFLHFELRPNVALTAALISAGAALLGTIFAVRRAALYPPAEAMRPEPPATYRQTPLERTALGRLLSPPTKMIARNINRRPVKSMLTVTGIALSCAIMMVGNIFGDAVDFMVEVQFKHAHREDLGVTLVEPTAKQALYELKSLPGVAHAEALRSVPAKLRYEHRSYRTSVMGIERGGVLYRLVDRELRPFDVPPEGIVLTDHLGKILGVKPGDMLTVEVLEGSRPVREVPVAGFVSEYIGVAGYMERTALNRLMREGDAISGAYLAVDRPYREGIYEKLNEMPRVAGTSVREHEIENFYETMSEQMLVFAFFNTVLAAIIALGVVYNSARIALSERSRELASLRVLGFTRGEISYILLGELGALLLPAIPLGFLIGQGLCAFMISKMQTDLYRVPLVIEPDTYAVSATVVLVSACISALLVKRNLDRLDLIAVLKTKE